MRRYLFGALAVALIATACVPFGDQRVFQHATPPVITTSHNNVQGNGTNYLGSATGMGSGNGNTSTALTWNTAKYGKGAYFMGATNAPVGDDGQPIGAHVLYEYKDGALTGTHLWPFPMEDRIWDETGNTALWQGASSLYKAYQQSPTWDGVTVADSCAPAVGGRPRRRLPVVIPRCVSEPQLLWFSDAPSGQHS